jgi:hypothetical protein
MNSPVLTCQDDQRRQRVRDKGMNGIDYVEVIDDHDQRELCVHFFGPAPEQMTPANVRIEGGRRVRDIRVISVTVEHADDPDVDECLHVVVDKPGDFSTYRLCLVALDAQGRPTDKPLAGFDPRYTCVDFGFKVGCASDLDCQTEPVCPTVERVEPEINYLAKDYASFRQLILDRLALLMPDWQERHVPDLGITLVELLAYVGDYLSYYQDAVATEAYLDTARQRISVRRHARLVDYFMHEGCNARAWVCVGTDDTDQSLLPKDIYFITDCAELAQVDSHVLSQLDTLRIPSSHYEVFEPLVAEPCTPIHLYAAHTTISFYTWGGAECCLPLGATRATLCDDGDYGRKLHLQAGDVLIFEEVKGPKTGNPADADPTHRLAVRLTRVEQGEDPLKDPPFPIVEIEWAAEDALPFALCLSAMQPAPDCTLLVDISVAHGNVILVDHGRTIDETIDGAVPTQETIGECACAGSVVEMTVVPGPFRPILQKAPVTFSQPPSFTLPASAMLTQEPGGALPYVTCTSIPAAPGGTGALFRMEDLQDSSELAKLAKRLREAQEPGARYLRSLLSTSTQDSLASYDASNALPASPYNALITDLYQLLREWTPRFDLLGSQSQDEHFVVEMDNDGRAHVRFGDGVMGRRPDAGMTFTAHYRIGNGRVGNVGAETITRLVLRQGTWSGSNLTPRNPLPAQSGTDPEPMAEVKLFAPGAFRKDMQRAITADDYAQLAQRNTKIQRAAAQLRWTGSWYEARIALDPLGTEEPSDTLLPQITRDLYRYRRMGHDLVVARARYVPLDIALTVCVLPHYLRGHVEAALLDVFSTRVLANGTRGFFHPDNLTFGAGIALSVLVAAAQAVPGVLSVKVTKLERLYEGPNDELENGILRLGSDEIAQLDNDPSFPEHGKLTLTMEGGR